MKHTLLATFLFSAFCCISTTLSAQDKIVLMNGNVLDVRITDDSGANVFFTVQKPNGKTREIDLYKADIFSVTKAGEEEKVIYAQDLDFGNDLTVSDMRYLIYGQGDARNGYNALPTMIGGFLYGAAGTVALDGGAVPFVVMPLSYSFGMQIPFIKIKENTITDQEFTHHETYIEGYNKTARSKKFFSAFVSTFAGVAVGQVIVELAR